MDDLISRQAAVELCLKYNGVGWVWSQILEEIEKMPSAERVAHWEKGRCSRCHAHAPFWIMASTYYLSNYCPNCGARMDERSE